MKIEKRTSPLLRTL